MSDPRCGAARTFSLHCTITDMPSPCDELTCVEPLLGQQHHPSTMHSVAWPVQQASQALPCLNHQSRPGHRLLVSPAFYTRSQRFSALDAWLAFCR